MDCNEMSYEFTSRAGLGAGAIADIDFLIDNEGITRAAAEDIIALWQWDVVRIKRSKLIAATDFTQVLDSPLTSTQIKAIAAYRQTLRDLPQQFSNTDDIVWPVKPE